MRATTTFAGLLARLAADPVATGLKQRHLQLLSMVCQHRGAMPMADAIEGMGLDASAVSRAAVTLAKAGLLTRSEVPHDLRLVALAPTDAGRDLARRVAAALAAAERVPRKRTAA